MISAGNDIVALKAINITRTKQQNFYRKIITETEKALYDKPFSEGLPFEQFVWLLWTIKESVYKYLQRINPGLIFSPTKIVIGQLDPPSNNTISIFESRGFNDPKVYKGTAEFGAHILYSRSIITEDFIFSVVNHINGFERVMWGIKLIDSSEPDRQSDAVRVFAIAMLSSLFPDAELEIGKSVYGYPVLLKNGDETPVPISLAHHDRYVAYSFQM
ncbi:MAG TPA: 4'-phosphopantetheinyl transferase superfamily protein [Mucilaginibacter sp.]|jgi:phosphopantetheinyl transferase (holo-ACP synthase)|nr:4'-phosphopantetheinyl transferase superfamily protein [Mucilaginibacter sp.]